MTTTKTIAHRDIVITQEHGLYYWACQTCGAKGQDRGSRYAPDAADYGRTHAFTCADDWDVTVTILSPDDSPQESV